MADSTIVVDIVDKSVPELCRKNIAIVNQPNPAIGVTVTGRQLLHLIQFPQYWITESATGNAINGRNIFQYFPDLDPEGGGGGSSGWSVWRMSASIASSIARMFTCFTSLSYERTLKATRAAAKITTKPISRNSPLRFSRSALGDFFASILLLFKLLFTFLDVFCHPFSTAKIHFFPELSTIPCKKNVF